MLRRLTPAALGLVALVLAIPNFGVASVQAKVKLNRSSFASGCTVPKLKGHSLSYARYKMVKAGCRVGSVTKRFSATVKKNHVISQRPVPGKRVPGGTRLNMVISKGVDAAYCAAQPGTCYRLSLQFSGGSGTYTPEGHYAIPGQPYSYTLSVKNIGPATVQTPTVYLDPWQYAVGNNGNCSVSSPTTVITSASPQPNSLTQGHAEGVIAGQWKLGDLKPGASKKVATFTVVWPSCYPAGSMTQLNTWSTSPSRPGYTWLGSQMIFF
jgi:hypothetical protein